MASWALRLFWSPLTASPPSLQSNNPSFKLKSNAVKFSEASARAFRSRKSRAVFATDEANYGLPSSSPSSSSSSSTLSYTSGAELPEHDGGGLLDQAEYLPGRELGASIAGHGVDLLYGPYMDHLWTILKEKVPGLRSLSLAPDYRVQKASKARVHNWLLCGNKLRRIRMTYFDGGSAGQAFNSLLYPYHSYDLPLLGIDLLSFGSNKILCVVDFQPLSQDPEYLEKYTSELGPVHARFRDLCGQMTNKFFDENQFFSKHLIIFRSNLGSKECVLQVPTGQLWEVYVAYVDIYLKILNEAEANDDASKMAFVQARQDAYDQYNAERDPAIKLFNTYFGTEWSSRYTKDFLFPGASICPDIL